jgi:hypothetical protein
LMARQQACRAMGLSLLIAAIHVYRVQMLVVLVYLLEMAEDV